MSSPVLVSIEKRLKYTDKHLPKYMQLSQAILQTIVYLPIPTNEKIPSSRVLSELTNWHRKTVIAAIDNLILEGILYAQPGKGYFVNNFQWTRKESPISNLHGDELIDPEINVYKFSSTNYSILKNNYIKKTPTFKFNKPQIFSSNAYRNFLKTYHTLYNKNIFTKQLYFQETSAKEDYVNEITTWINQNNRKQIQQEHTLIHTNITGLFQAVINQLWLPNDAIIISPNCPISIIQQVKEHGIKIIYLPIKNKKIDFKRLHDIQKKYCLKGILLDLNNNNPYFEKLQTADKIQIIQHANIYKIPIVEICMNQIIDKHEPIIAMDNTGSSIYVLDYQYYLPHNHNMAIIFAPEKVIKNCHNHLFLHDNMINTATILSIIQMIKNKEWQRSINKQNVMLKKATEKVLEHHFKIIPTMQNKIYLMVDAASALKQLLNYFRNNNVEIHADCIHSNQYLHAISFYYNEMNYEELAILLSSVNIP